MRCAVPSAKSIDPHVFHRGNAVGKSLFQRIHPIQIGIQVLIHLLCSFSHACDCRNIFCTGAQSPLLSAAEQAEAETELDLLRQSLIERRRKEAMEQIRKAVAVLEPRNEIGRCLFTKEPEPLKRDNTYRYQHDVLDLLRALDMIAERNARQLPPPAANFAGIVGAEPYPVTKKAQELLKRLVLRGVARFKSLFRGNRSRSEIVATFLAILELCRVKSVHLEDTADGADDVDVVFEKMPEESI